MQTTVATQPKVDRITVAMVRDAYERTGLHPVRNCYRDDEDGACPLYVVALMFDQQDPDDERDRGDFIQRTLQLPPGYFTGFLQGYDNPDDYPEKYGPSTPAYHRGFYDGKAVAIQLLGRTAAECDPPPAASYRSAVP